MVRTYEEKGQGFPQQQPDRWVLPPAHIRERMWSTCVCPIAFYKASLEVALLLHFNFSQVVFFE